MPKAKRRLKNFDFSNDDAHVALVDAAANGLKVLVTKKFDQVGKREFSTEQREKLAEEGKAMPDGSFPIITKADLKNAIKAFGRAKNKTAVARHIKKRAKALGATDLIPEDGKLAELAKRFDDHARFDSELGEMVPLKESGLRVNMSLEDMLMFFTDLFPEDIETLTSAIEKAKDGEELGDILKVHIEKNPDVLPLDVFTARREEFQEKLQKLDGSAMDVLREASLVINEFLDRGENSPSIPDLVEKSEMSKENEGKTPEEIAELEKKKVADDATAAAAASEDVSEAVPANVQKSLDEKDETIQKQANRLTKLEKAEDNRVTAVFITKAKGFSILGLPAVEEGKDADTEFGLALKALSDANPEAYAQVESVLTKALETVEKGENLEQIGEDGQPEATDSAIALAKAADDIRKDDSSLTQEQAVTKALDANPELYG